MPKPEYPVTPAIRVLREKGVAFKPHLYAYEEHGGTRLSAAALNFTIIGGPASDERD